MQYHALAVDYDNTLATYGYVDETTLEALRRLRQSGRRLILVTGRCLDSLLIAFPQIRICDLVVAENGALIYNPETEDRRLQGRPPPEEFIHNLAQRGVPPLERGEVILSTCMPHEHSVLSAIRDFGIELQIIFNKTAVMILPTGINKATGLRAALAVVGLSPHNVVGIGDAENDEAFLDLSEVGVAVSNALPSVKEHADIILQGSCSAGVRELISRLLEDDLQGIQNGTKSKVCFGNGIHGDEFNVPVYHSRVLVTGESGKGKSRLALGVIEQLMEAEYQVCVIDPEGDYQDIPNALVLGTPQQPPTIDEVLQVLKDPVKSCVVSLFAAPKEGKPELAARLTQALMDCRSRAGRPHWTVIDEAHHLFPTGYKPHAELNLSGMKSVMYITPFPEQMSEDSLKNMDFLVSLGGAPIEALEKYCGIAKVSPPKVEEYRKPNGYALGWNCSAQTVTWFQPATLKSEHLRHRHMYLEGDMEPENRFYFRGPKGELNLAVQNLKMFMQIAEGVDEETWMYHLRRGDYSRWFRDEIKDAELAQTAEGLESDKALSPRASLEKMIEVIRLRYEKGF